MADPIRCSVCNGRKTILGMGGMYRDCWECNGVGWVDGTDHADELDVSEIPSHVAGICPLPDETEGQTKADEYIRKPATYLLTPRKPRVAKRYDPNTLDEISKLDIGAAVTTKRKGRPSKA